MALIDKASLLMVPSTYEAGKLYNVLPSGNRAPDSTNQNSGYDQSRADFTFDRGSNAAATRVNASGLIEKYRENLLLQSNNFGTTWATTNASVTSGQSGYDGLNNAWELKENTSTGVHEIIQILSVSTGVHTYSLKVSANTRSKMALVLAGSAFNSGGNGVGIFNLTNGTLISSSGSLIDAKITSLGGNWYNVSITKLASSSSAVAVVQLVDDSNNTNYAGNGTGSVLIQSAQLESGLVASSYLESTSVTGKAGVLVDLPRINYDANGQNGALLLEPSRANLIPQSEWFSSGSGWSLDGGTQSVTSNYSISPEGVKNAARLQLDKTGTTYSRLYVDAGSIGEATISVYMKSNTSQTQNVGLRYDGTGVNCEVTSEWKRFDLTATSTSVSRFQILLFDSIAGNDETADILIYGAQLESSASYATSYIPTMGTSETRAVDSAITLSVPEAIGQTEGTWFVEYTRNSLIESSYMVLSNLAGTTAGSYQNGIYLFQIDGINQNFVSDGFVSNVKQFGFSKSGGLSLGKHKIAIAYKQNDFALYIDGVQIGTDTSGNVPQMNYLTIGGGADVSDHRQSIHQTILFNERLTNSELATLTTL